MHSRLLNLDASQPLFRRTVELGITFWATASIYQDGSSYDMAGRAGRRSPSSIGPYLVVGSVPGLRRHRPHQQ